MVQRRGGFRSGTRHSLKKRARTAGKIGTNRFMQEFKTGDRVILSPEPAIHKAMPHPRYKAKSGIVIGMQGRVYKVQVQDGGLKKIFLSAPVHLTKV